MTGLFDGFEGYQILADADVDRALTSALVAVDANVLLNLYRYNLQTTKDLLTVFERLGDRLVVPHQAIREFHRNRLTAIGNPDGAAQDVRTALVKNQRSTVDALTRWAKQVALADGDLDQLKADATAVFDRLLEAVDKAEPDRVQADTPAAEDRVLKRLAVLLNGKVLAQPPQDEWTQLIADGKRRVEEQQPPGYLDADKDDDHPEGPAGDFLVYRQACEEANRRKLDLVIITGDEKDDWWWRHRSVVIGPRQEMTKEFFDLSGGRRLFLLRPRDLLLRSAALDVTVNPASLEDASRERDDLIPAGAWTDEAVGELLRRLDAEGQVQADVIREAAVLGGTISREILYGLCGYDDERMLRGFTRPAARITTDLQREGLLPDPVTPVLKPLYPDGVRASGFRIPSEIVAIVRAASGAEPDLDADRGVPVGGKYGLLTEWLNRQTADSIPVTFAELEEVIGSALAPSARNHPPYWYSVRNSLGRAIAAGGYKPSRVNLTAETATLIRR